MDEILRTLNEDEILLVCKIKLKDDRNISVGKVIMRYARLEKDMQLFRKIHSRLLETDKYEETNEIDKFGLNHLRYKVRKSFIERNWYIKDILKWAIPIIATAIVSYFIGTKNGQSQSLKEYNTTNAEKKDTSNN